MADERERIAAFAMQVEHACVFVRLHRRRYETGFNQRPNDDPPDCELGCTPAPPAA
jgi:hypothetical protein